MQGPEAVVELVLSSTTAWMRADTRGKIAERRRAARVYHSALRSARAQWGRDWTLVRIASRAAPGRMGRPA